MSVQRAEPIERYLAAIASDGGWPGASYAVGPPGELPEWSGSVGRLASDSESSLSGRETLYDLASLTKPLATAFLAGRLATLGALDLDAPLDEVLPELAGYAGRTPSMRDLLMHRAGLPSWRPLYRSLRSPLATSVLDWIGALQPCAEAGERAEYGCLGYVAAGIALERITGDRLDDQFRNALLEPSGVSPTELLYGPLATSMRARVAPTERGRGREAVLAQSAEGDAGREIVPGNDEPLHGEVHDGNAAFLGGVSGNAGLFGTSEAVFRLVSHALFDESFIDVAIVTSMARGWSGRAGGEVRTLGFQAGDDRAAPSGALGERSFGHTGFTGTSVWVSREPATVAVLLTNRVHPVWRDDPVRSWRGGFHDLASAAARCS